MQKNYALIFL